MSMWSKALSWAPYRLARLRALAHYHRKRVGGGDGVEHAVVVPRHPQHGVLAVLCGCGRTFWLAPLMRPGVAEGEVPQGPPKGADPIEVLRHRREFRRFWGLHLHDPGAAKKRRRDGPARRKKASRRAAGNGSKDDPAPWF